MENERSIDRLYAFCKWCIENNLVHSLRDFEAQCGLAIGYVRNSMLPSNKGSIGADVMASVKRAFPMLSLDWLVLGEGNIVTTIPTGGYVARYQKLEKAFSDIDDIIKKLKLREKRVRSRK